MIHQSYQTGQSACLKEYTVQCGCEGTIKQLGGKAGSTYISLPLKGNGGLERVLQKFSLNLHNILETYQLLLAANLHQGQVR